MSGTAARILTAVVLIPLVAWLVLWGPTWLVAIVVAGIILLALHEFFALGAKMNMPGYPKFTMVCAVGIVLAMSRFADPGPYPSFLTQLTGPPEMYIAVFIIGVACLVLAAKGKLSDSMPSGAVSAAGLLFVAWPLSYLVRFHADSPRFLLFVLVLVWVGDSAAFFVGRMWGRRLLAPVISPKKTWEGAVANVVATALAGLVFSRWLSISPLSVVGGAVVISVAGQLGDLFESAWKRAAGVKDSGNLLPGHGGILDRIDALILAVPAVWWYFSRVLEFSR